MQLTSFPFGCYTNPDNIVDEETLFLARNDTSLNPSSIRKLVKKYYTKAGVRKSGVHTLRHTFATYKAGKGVSPFQLQQWLGHANLNTTQIYVHLGKQNAKKIMQDTSLV
jgi:integrase/recombinase XerD